MLEIARRADSSVIGVDQTCSASEAARYRLAVGQIMGCVYDVLAPIFRVHPELEPASFREPDTR